MLKKRDEKDDSDESFDKIIDALAISARNCNLITQLLVILNNADSDGRTSPNVSIHSLETLAIDGPNTSRQSLAHGGRSTEYNSEEDKVESDYANDNDDLERDDTGNSSSDSSNDTEPTYNLEIEENNQGVFNSWWELLKFIVILLLNLVVLVMTMEFLFLSVSYAITGERYIEFVVDKSPQSWLDKAKTAAFGPEDEIIRIRSLAEMFYKDNIIGILKFFIRCLKFNKAIDE